MTGFFKWILATAVVSLFTCLASAQIGTIEGRSAGRFSCTATAAGTPLLRPEGFTELIGDIYISCTGGPTYQVGANIPTANVVVYIQPTVPITSRMLGPSPSGQPGTFASEALLMIDEPGSGLSTGATGGYGPQAPQALCTSAQQQYPSPCAAVVGVDNSGQYEVSVLPGTTTPAPNVYQGEVGDFGVQSVTFYNVPVLPPATNGVSRIFRITNIRIPVAGTSINYMAAAFLSTSPNQTLPLDGSPINVGVVGPPMTANVNAAPAGGGNPFAACVLQTSPALATRLTFTEGFATGFKTRVVPGGASNGMPDNSIGNTTWAAEAQNLSGQANQNIPGGLYGGFASNSESGFIPPAAAFTDTTSNITYTAGLSDFGTRLKAVFSYIPTGVTLYVSTTGSNNVAIPGGTSTTPYAVLVAGSQNDEGNGDGATFTPLSSTVVGSDGLFAYPLTVYNSGVASAIWEVVNADPRALDSLTFSVYLSYSNPSLAYQQTYVALSYAPEPGGGTFPNVDATYGLDSPLPRFYITNSYAGPAATVSPCGISATGPQPVFSYTFGGTVPASQTVSVTVVPSNLAVTATPTVLSPANGNWLSASISGSTLTISVNPAGLAASATAYNGVVLLSATGLPSVGIPVTLTVSPPPAQLSIVKSHAGNFSAGQLGSTYTIAVSNGASAGPTNGTVTVTENPPSGMSVASMTSPGNAWTCTTTTCTIGTSIGPGQSYPSITVTVNVAPAATSPLVNQAVVGGGGSLAIAATSDTTIITPLTCIVTGGRTPSVADVQMLINQALGIVPATYDFTGDGAINVADVQIIVNAALGFSCQ